MNRSSYKQDPNSRNDRKEESYRSYDDKGSYDHNYKDRNYFSKSYLERDQQRHQGNPQQRSSDNRRYANSYSYRNQREPYYETAPSPSNRSPILYSPERRRSSDRSYNDDYERYDGSEFDLRKEEREDDEIDEMSKGSKKRVYYPPPSSYDSISNKREDDYSSRSRDSDSYSPQYSPTHQHQFDTGILKAPPNFHREGEYRTTYEDKISPRYDKNFPHQNPFGVSIHGYQNSHSSRLSLNPMVQIPYGVPHNQSQRQYHKSHGGFYNSNVKNQYQDRKAYRDSERGRSSNNERNSQREQGLILSLKPTFGFITCLEREEEIFFPFSEIVWKDAKDNELGLHVGDEVSFVIKHQRDKFCATDIHKLPKGSSSFYDVIEERFEGIVEKEPKTIKNKTEEGSYGFIKYTLPEKYHQQLSNSAHSQSQQKMISFTINDIEHKNLVPRIRDEVTFQIIVEKKSLKKRAIRVQLKTLPPLEFGRVILVNRQSQYGFIQSPKRNDQIYFRLSDVFQSIYSSSSPSSPKSPSSQTSSSFSSENKNIEKIDNIIQMRDEVEFRVWKDPKTEREKAFDIRILPKGSVFTVYETRLKGRVEKPFHSKHEKSVGGGIISFMNTDGQEERLSFQEADLGSNKLNKFIQKEDEVEFSVMLDKKSKEMSATEVELVKMGTEERETGKISNIHGTYGFINCFDREGQMFFHFSELLNSDPNMNQSEFWSSIVSDTEVEFTVSVDEKKQQNATRIIVLPKGSISYEIMIEDKIRGTVVSVPSKQKQDLMGKISVDLAADQKDIVTFTKEVVENIILTKGDQVEFNVIIDKRTAKKRASNIVLVSSERREKGVINLIKDDSGLIRPINIDSDISFQLSEYKVSDCETSDDQNYIRKELSIQIGREVEFTLKSDRRELTAINVIPLIPPNSLLKKEYLGVVTECKHVKGKISQIKPYDSKKQNKGEENEEEKSENKSNHEKIGTLSFGKVDIKATSTNIMVGMLVKFTLYEGTKTPFCVNALRESGRVKAIVGTYGFIIPNSDVRTSELFFHMSEVESKNPLHVDERVSFYIYEGQKGNLCAMMIKKMKQQQHHHHLKNTTNGNQQTNHISASTSTETTSSKISSNSVNPSNSNSSGVKTQQNQRSFQGKNKDQKVKKENPSQKFDNQPIHYSSTRNPSPKAKAVSRKKI